MQNALRPFIDALALFGNGDATRGAVQQNHIQVLLKQRNAFTDIGRRNTQFLGDDGESRPSGDQNKDA